MGFPDSCSTTALTGPARGSEEKCIQIQIFQSPTLSHHAHTLPLPMAAPGPPQQQNPPSSSASAQQQPQLPTNPDQISWDGDKMYLSFPRSLSLAHPSIPQVQHLHLGLLQKARLSQDRKRIGQRGRHLSRLQTAYQRSARSSLRVRPFSFFISTHLIHFLGGGAYFGCYFRPKTMAPGLRMLCSITRCLTSATSVDPPHLVPDSFSLVSSIRTS